jgi:hypothetical protein
LRRARRATPSTPAKRFVSCGTKPPEFGREESDTKNAVDVFASLKLDDRTQYHNRLDALTKRVASVLGSAFSKLDEEEVSTEGEADELLNANANAAGTSDDAENESANSANITRFSRGAVDVDAFASAVASRCVSLRDDASAKKATKKKAFVDLLKALPSVGVRSARKAVPESQRSPESWFREPPLAKPAFLVGARLRERDGGV